MGVELIDVSSNNHWVDWKAVAKFGIKGAWLKATEGATWNDAWFDANRRRATAVGIRVGAYHYARPDRNAARDEADHFCNIVGAVGRRDLRPMLDLERIDGVTLHPSELEAWARTFNQQVVARLGVLPAFYSYPYYIKAKLLGLQSPIGNGLWLASYGPNDGKRHDVVVPKPWKKIIAHQYTSKGRVPGVNGSVDRSYAPRLTGVLAHPVLGLL